jgi:hypothetical protein
LSSYATTSSLSAYATTSSLSSYATTSSLSAYATTADLRGYMTVDAASDHVRTAALSDYATTDSLSEYALQRTVASFPPASDMATAVRNVDDILADYLDSDDYVDLATQADTWPSGPYCILRGADSCPAGFTRHDNHLRAIWNYHSNGTYLRSNTFAGNGVRYHSPANGNGWNGDVYMNMCCKSQ